MGGPEKPPASGQPSGSQARRTLSCHPPPQGWAAVRAASLSPVDGVCCWLSAASPPRPTSSLQPHLSWLPIATVPRCPTLAALHATRPSLRRVKHVPGRLLTVLKTLKFL